MYYKKYTPVYTPLHFQYIQGIELEESFGLAENLYIYILRLHLNGVQCIFGVDFFISYTQKWIVVNNCKYDTELGYQMDA